jgi:hypothetical protein
LQVRFRDSLESNSMIRSPHRRERCGRRSTRRQDRLICSARLDQIINMRHELVQLAGKVDWEADHALVPGRELAGVVETRPQIMR